MSGFRNRSRSRDHRHGTNDSNRRDYCRDDRRGRDRAPSDRSDRRGERRRSTERKKADSPELPRANKFFDRARKLGIVPDTTHITTPASSSSSDAEQTTSAQPSTAVAASLAAARALALSASLTQAGVNRNQTLPLGLPLGASGIGSGGVAIPSPNPDVPSYYNPANVNTQRIADQIKKRKMLWTRPGSEEGKKEENSAGEQHSDQSQAPGSSTVKHWAKATFKGDDGKMTAKFRKLMGIKDDDLKDTPLKDSSKVLDEQDQLFKHLDQQYQAARATTHTQRGMGLGWGH
ncbi:arginine/serine-rich coiled-coil protein 2-like isoform X2 [Varroa jacobsoni]|nr:arginine/serine-rich coiled-coil protein 2-like isoform X2 [Varroa destructor]XP_022710438.1 arginine/serine-rich coiled-coil protein 2-like isoform X2 [Varroa jacobsoni]